MAELQRLDVTTDALTICAAIEQDGGVIVEGLLPQSVVDRVNAEVEAEVAAADPSRDMFNPAIKFFHGAQTKQVAGMPGVSYTFATDVMCHPTLLAVAD